MRLSRRKTSAGGLGPAVIAVTDSGANLSGNRMLNRKIRTIAIVMAGMLVAVGATSCSSATTMAANSGHAQAAAAGKQHAQVLTPGTAASDVRPGHASAGCPDSMRVWVPSVSTVSASDPEAVAPPDISAATRVAYGTHVAHLLSGRKIHWLGTIDCKQGYTQIREPRAHREHENNESGNGRHEPQGHRQNENNESGKRRHEPQGHRQNENNGPDNSPATALGHGNPAGGQQAQVTAARTATGEQPAQYTDNWSGYQSGAGHFTDASMEWKVPTIAAPRAHVTTALSIWPGIGTGNTRSDSLIQAGTGFNTVSFGPFGPFTFKYLWWQIVPQMDDEVIINNLPISTKDQIAVDVSYDPTSHNAMFLICDLSENTCGEQTTHVAGSSGGTAEWIVERMSFLGPPDSLSHFGKETITGAGAVQTADGVSTGNSIGGLSSYYPIIMSCNDGFGPVLATPGPLANSDSFTVRWKNGGPRGNC